MVFKIWMSGKKATTIRIMTDTKLDLLKIKSVMDQKTGKIYSFNAVIKELINAYNNEV